MKDSKEKPHISVLLYEAIEALCCQYKTCGTFVDATFGRGGHSCKILDSLGEQGRLWGMDKDPSAHQTAEQLAQQDARFSFIASCFSEINNFFNAASLDGVLLDLGVSSPQLDQGTRGFSFMHDGPLDMRMNPKVGISAAQWLQSVSEQEIARVLWEYGEERFSRRIARAIIQEQKKNPIHSTIQLAEIIKAAHPRWEKHKHPATRSFQAIRIMVNNELEVLSSVLESIPPLLKEGGRMVIISFHSLEDRLVKQFMRKMSARYDTSQPRWVAQKDTVLKPVLCTIGKAIKPSAEEQKNNIRSRSAVLRIAEKKAL